ncbi:MAG: helix-turn-helix domain-containing protein [Acidobacteriota bacterium]
MTQTSSKKPPAAAPRPHPWNQGGDSEPMSFGTWLRRQREMREVGLREISEASKIGVRYLQALEDDRFDVLPAPVFVKGFLREYAKLVGLNPDEVINYSRLAIQGTRAAPAAPATPAVAPRRPPARDWMLGLLLALGVLVLLGIVALLAFYAERRRSAAPANPPPIAAPPAATPVATPEVSPTPARDVPLRVSLDFSADCWVEATADGKRRTSELRVRGESLQIEAQESVVLSLQNAAGVRLEVNGRAYPLKPGADNSVRDLRIDLQTARDLGG